MKRLLRWIGLALGGLAGLAIIAYVILYVMSERVLQGTYEIPAVTLAVPTDPASIAEGQRLATTRGCVFGCHGKQAQGEVMIDEPMLAHLVRPTLRPLSANTAMQNSPSSSGMACGLERKVCL